MKVKDAKELYGPGTKMENNEGFYKGKINDHSTAKHSLFRALTEINKDRLDFRKNRHKTND